ncbi:MAG: diacylglycerol kinase family lipid kinase [Treponema sp.]|jgi:YegS/Rv2252/BmrU family lipid kinase|nr:diacylglycerol kinase family lipid kinase [Treponema sp.]
MGAPVFEKLWIILNPVAGKGKAISHYPVIKDYLEQHKQNFEIILTTGPGDALEIARNCPPGDAVIAAGGDGTCNEVVNGLLTRQKPPPEPPFFGLLPIGRGNDFSCTAQIPPEPVKALDILLQKKSRPLDAGFVKGGFFPEGRYFVNGLGIGFDAKVGFEAAKMKKIHSSLSYALGAIITVARYETPPVIQIKYDGKETTNPSAIVSIMNGRRMGGTFFMGPNALLDDGLLDICIIRHPKSRLRLIQIVLKYPKGAQAECEETFMDRGAHLHLKALTGGMAAHCDGETVCLDGKELEVSCLPGVLRLIGA